MLRSARVFLLFFLLAVGLGWTPARKWLTGGALEATVPLDEAPVDSVAYGFDRLAPLSATAEGNWLPEVEVTSGGQTYPAQFSADQFSFEAWTRAREQILLLGTAEPTLPLSTSAPLWLLRPEDWMLPEFGNTLRQFVPFREVSLSSSFTPSVQDCEREQPAAILLTEGASWQVGDTLADRLLDWAEHLQMVVVHVGAEPPPMLPVPVLWLRSRDAAVQALAAQALVGALPGGLEGDGHNRLRHTRLGHAPPEWAGIDREALAKVDQLANWAIRGKATPGCQVLVVKNGAIVYDRAFGFHTYEHERPVRADDLYDLASITKAAATTLGVMKLLENKQVALGDRLRSHLPRYEHSGIRYYRIRHLLAHQTGLQANLPVWPWLRKPPPFTPEPKGSAEALAPGVYLPQAEKDEMLERIANLPLQRRSRYRYGDVHFVLLQQLVEHYFQQPLDSVVREEFYGPMGLHRLAFRPGLVFPSSELVPTAFDGRWRKRLLQGEVHDEGAALLGGVAGHAGLFGNGRDLATLFQMLLWEGAYGGRRYFKPATVQTFMERNAYNYRAYGFDRLAGHSRKLQAYGASPDAFGHTGFTGGCVWADPENDLIFVFLSNRVYPDPDNERLWKLGVRERIHQAIYESLDTFEPEV